MQSFDEVSTAVPDRGSLRSRGAGALSSLTLRQISAVLPPEQAWGLWASRQIVARLMATFGPRLAGTSVQTVQTTTPDGRAVAGEWVCGSGVEHGPQETVKAIYYLHGSGYALCSPRTHRRLTAWLSTLTGLPVFCVDYRLAPLHRFPAAADDVRAGWDWLLQTHAPDRLVVAGDSAGGHLAVDLLLQPEVAARPPAGLVMFSPLYDVTFALARGRERFRRDPAIRSRDAVRLLELYCSGVDPMHPRLALDVANGPVLPPTLIQAGGAEMLAADAHRLAADIRAAGGRCALQVWPDQPHVFQALPRLTPEATAAMREAVRFIGAALPAEGHTLDADDEAQAG